MRVTRKDKKKLRAITLCYTSNPDARKVKRGKANWIKLKQMFHIWFKVFSKYERTVANTVK